MIFTEQEKRRSAIETVAEKMMIAARTAPKARGTDNLSICMVTGEDILKLAAELEKLGKEAGLDFFLRDSACVASSEAVVLIGTANKPLGLDCGYCGFPSCAAKCSASPMTPCIFNSNDLGIAVGSAVSVAADNRVDNRVMFSAGVAASSLGMLPECCYILAIPLSCSGKSRFFDRPAL